jgi:hypothetical protein
MEPAHRGTWSDNFFVALMEFAELAVAHSVGASNIALFLNATIAEQIHCALFLCEMLYIPLGCVFIKDDGQKPFLATGCACGWCLLDLTGAHS